MARSRAPTDSASAPNPVSQSASTPSYSSQYYSSQYDQQPRPEVDRNTRLAQLQSSYTTRHGRGVQVDSLKTRVESVCGFSA